MGYRLLDLFCGAGGCSVGYARAGFDVYGVDAADVPLKQYPYPYLWADAMAVLRGDPPAYTEHVGAQVLNALDARR